MFIVTNKMQRNTTFFTVVKALHVSGGFPAHHQELKNCTTASVVEMELRSIPTTLAVASTKLNKYQMLHVQFLSS
jgi:hypothetical protein